MAAHSDFFGKRSAKAVLKHGILTRYAYYFAGRAGRATGGRVAFVDGYAGAGRYEDGSPGSPLLLASQAEQAKLFGRKVKLSFVEPKPSIRRRLVKTLDDAGVEVDEVLGEQLGGVVDHVLSTYRRHAVFLFVDPFGLAIDRSQLERILQRSAASQPIDVLYHFSLSSLARMGRVGSGDTENAEWNATQIDSAVGRLPWREVFRTADGEGEPTRAAIGVARDFANAVSQQTGMRWTGVPVRQRPTHLPKYYLILFTKESQALWDFADLAGKSYADWLHHCDLEDYRANLEQQDRYGLQTLFDDPEPELEDIDTELAQIARQYLDGHLRELFSERRAVRPIDQIEDLYGQMFGRARVTHLRAAIKNLHRQGLIDDDGTRDFFDRTIHWQG